MSNNTNNECSTQATQTEGQCAVEQSVNKTCCPIEQSVKQWNGVFFQAMKNAQTDILTEKIKKAWGPMLEQKADAVLKSMSVQWETTIDQAKAQCELRETFKDIVTNKK
ncbi:MAG: hypothetical protein ACI9CF_000641 [Candidatus Omnitrophota bacterium]|jgi:hypothetical protein